MLKTLFIASSICLSLPGSVAPELAFAPKEKSVVRKTFSETSTWSVDEVVQTVMGQPQPTDGLDMETTSTRTVTVLDTYGLTRAGRPVKLERVIEAATHAGSVDAAADGLSEEYEVELESPLAGARIGFEWDADAEAYERESLDDEAPDADLGLLLEDLDLRALLPQEDVEPGDSWDVDVEALSALFAPSGDLQFELAGQLDGNFQILEPADVAAATSIALGTAPGRAAGSVEARWKGTRESGDTTLAEIALEFDVQLSVDAANAYARVLATTPGGDARELVEYQCDWNLEGDGTLVWDVDAGRFHSLEVELDASGELDIVFEVDAGGQTIDVQLEVSLSGETELSATAQAAQR